MRTVTGQVWRSEHQHLGTLFREQVLVIENVPVIQRIQSRQRHPDRCLPQLDFASLLQAGIVRDKGAVPISRERFAREIRQAVREQPSVDIVETVLQQKGSHHPAHAVRLADDGNASPGVLRIISRQGRPGGHRRVGKETCNQGNRDEGHHRPLLTGEQSGAQAQKKQEFSHISPFVRCGPDRLSSPLPGCAGPV